MKRGKRKKRKCYRRRWITREKREREKEEEEGQRKKRWEGEEKTRRGTEGGD